MAYTTVVILIITESVNLIVGADGTQMHRSQGDELVKSDEEREASESKRISSSSFTCRPEASDVLPPLHTHFGTSES